MRERLKGKLTYANVMSTIAVFGMLATGSAFAASQIGTNDIKNGAVTARKLHSNAVTTQKIKNRSVTGAKVASQSLTGANIVASSLGPVASANHAANADELGGSPPSTYRNHCPSGMTLVGSGHDLCVDSTDRTTGVNWLDGANTCANVGLRLPSIGEALQASFPNEHYWTDDIYNDSSGAEAWQWYGIGLDNAPRSNLYNVRCVTSPSDA
jgi:hypothetical protein